MRLMRSTPRAPRAASCARGAAARAGCPRRAPADRTPRPAPKPSTSRSVTTRRCISGSVSIASRPAATASPESAIARRSRSTGGSARPSGRRPGWARARNARDPPPARPRRRCTSDENGARARLANAARAGEVHHDAEEVGAQGRAALELVEAAQQADPGLLGDVLGDLLGGDVLARHAHERGVVELDEPLEGPLVAGAQRGQQGRFLAAVAAVCSRGCARSPVSIGGRRYTAPAGCRSRPECTALGYR